MLAYTAPLAEFRFLLAEVLDYEARVTALRAFEIWTCNAATAPGGCNLVLGVPVVGVGLLYQQGYFRQVLDASGRQQELYPYNDPTSLPIQPVLAMSGGWLHVALTLPGRTLLLRVWQARVGRVSLYLLDSNDPLNSPADRGITSELYGGGPELRLVQELVLGIGGWRLLEALGLQVDVCHLNEGHAAFVVLERVRHFMAQHGVSFWEALCATRAGNVFTTHTPVAAGFDTLTREAYKLGHDWIWIMDDDAIPEPGALAAPLGRSGAPPPEFKRRARLPVRSTRHRWRRRPSTG